MRYLCWLGGVLLLVLVWHYAPYFFDWPSRLFPSFRHLLNELPKHYVSLMNNTEETIIPAFMGFGFAIIFASGTAITGCLSDKFHAVVEPIILISQVTPKVVLAPIIYIILNEISLSVDIYNTAKVILSAVIGFLPLYTAMDVGLRNIEKNRLLLFKSMNASRWQTFKMLRLYLSLPNFLASLRVSYIFCLIGALTVEFISYKPGLGTLIISQQNNLEYDLMYLAVIVCALLGGTGFIMLRFIELCVNKFILRVESTKDIQMV